MTRPSPVTEDRIRELAYLLWLEEGQPDGKSAEHWEKARELLALESESEEDIEGISEGYNGAPPGVPAEEAALPESLGEFPAQNDQGKQKSPKKRRPSVTKKRAM